MTHRPVLEPGWQGRLAEWLLLMALVGALATVAGFASRYGWLFELASHFRVQYGVALTLCAIGLVLLRRYRLAIGCVLLAIGNLVLLLPFYPLHGRTAMAASGPSLRAVTLNLHHTNTAYPQVRAALTQLAPDVIVLQEVTRHWLTELTPLRAAYPHVIAEPREDPFGIALFSRLPFAQADIVPIGTAGLPSVIVRLKIDGKSLTLIGTHPLPPVSPQAAGLRNQQLVALAARVRQTTTEPVLLMGDLNITPWSCYFQQLLSDSGLRDSAIGHGIQSTWPVSWWPLWIPIDHGLYSTGITIETRQVGNAVGSDHYPLVIEFSLNGSDAL